MQQSVAMAIEDYEKNLPLQRTGFFASMNKRKNLSRMIKIQNKNIIGSILQKGREMKFLHAHPGPFARCLVLPDHLVSTSPHLLARRPLRSRGYTRFVHAAVAAGGQRGPHHRR